jgi:hypothetical protein
MAAETVDVQTIKQTRRTTPRQCIRLLAKGDRIDFFAVFQRTQTHFQMGPPPIATKRLSVDGQGRVVYRYKQPFRDGSTHVALEPLDFIARLAS